MCSYDIIPKSMYKYMVQNLLPLLLFWIYILVCQVRMKKMLFLVIHCHRYRLHLLAIGLYVIPIILDEQGINKSHVQRLSDHLIEERCRSECGNQETENRAKSGQWSPPWLSGPLCHRYKTGGLSPQMWML